VIIRTAAEDTPITSAMRKIRYVSHFCRFFSGSAPKKPADNLNAEQGAKQGGLPPTSVTQTVTSDFKTQEVILSDQRLCVDLGSTQAGSTATAANPNRRLRDGAKAPKFSIAASRRAAEMPILLQPRTESDAVRPDADNDALQRSSSIQVAFMQRYRRQIIEQEGYLIYGDLESALIRQFGDRRGWSCNLVEACSALRRLLSAVEGTIDSALSTNTVVTLHDVQEILKGQKWFSKVGSFQELDIGSLVHNRKVVASFQPSLATLKRGEVPDVTTTEVLAAFAKEMNPGGKLWPREEQKQAIVEILDDFAKRKGFEQGRDLCVHIRAETFVVNMLSRSKRHAHALNEVFREHTASALGFAIQRHRTETIQSEVKAYRKVIEEAACGEVLQAEKWWRAIQRAVCDSDVEPAIRLVRRLLLSLPKELEQRDQMLATQQGSAWALNESNDNEGISTNLVELSDTKAKYACPDCQLKFRNWSECRTHLVLTGHADSRQPPERGPLSEKKIWNSTRQRQCRMQIKGAAKDKVEVGKAADDGLQRLVHHVAPIVVCAMRQLQLESDAGRVLVSFDAGKAAFAVASFLRNKPLKLRLDVVQQLAEAEELLWGALSLNSSRAAPSLLHLLLENEQLKRLLDCSSSPDVLSGKGVKAPDQNHDSEAVNESQVLDAVKGVLLETFAAEVPADEFIDRLARAEEQVCEVFSAGSFHALTPATSFLRFCASSARQITPLLHFECLVSGKGARLGSADETVRPRLLELIHLSTQPPDAERCTPVHIQAVVERHFGVRLRSLGYLTIEEIMAEPRTPAPSHTRRTEPVYSGQSLLWHDPAEEAKSKDGIFSEALNELRMAPFLVDLAEWMDWSNVFFSALGPWPDFINKVWNESGGSQALGSLLLEVQSGRHVKLPIRPSTHDFNEALHRFEALEAAAIAVSLAVESGSVAALSASFQLLRAQVEGRLSTVDAAHAAQFVLTAAAAVPGPLRPALAVPLFVDALLAAVPGAERALSAQCRTLADRAALRQFGLTCGKLVWIAGAASSSVNPAAEMTAGRQDVTGGTTAVVASAGMAEAAAIDAAQAAGPAPPSHVEDRGWTDSEVAGDGIHPDTQRVCARVRRGFGLEPDQPPPTAATLAVVNKSIERLAADLYAKEVHFILEVSAPLPSSSSTSLSAPRSLHPPAWPTRAAGQLACLDTRQWALTSRMAVVSFERRGVEDKGPTG
jgi:hypothetical protein